MTVDGDGDPHVATRRRALGLLGLGVAGATGGCGGLFGTSDPSTDAAGDTPRGTTAEPPSTGTDATPGQAEPGGRHVGHTPRPPAAVQYNPFNPADQPAISHHVLFEPLAKYYYAHDEFRPAAVRSWGLRDGRFELRLREDLVWTNDTAVTATDLATQLRIGRYVDDPVRDWATAVDTPDERTVAIDVDGPRNPTMLARDVFADRFLRTHRDRYGPLLQELRDGASLDVVRDYVDAEPITCGPFRLVDRDDQRLLAERFGAHPDASAVGVDEYAFVNRGEEFSAPQALRELTVDSVHERTIPEDVVAAFPDAVESVTTPAMIGAGIVPNHAHVHAGDRALRRAIAAVVDRERAVEASLPLSKRAPAVPTALAPGVREKWLGGAAAFDRYGPGSLTERATTILEAGGYERRDGTWIGPDGATVTLPVTVPTYWSDWRAVAERVVGDLSAFGFDATVDATRSWESVLARGEFVLAVASWLPGGRIPTPHRTLRHQLWAPALEAVRYGYPGASDADAVGGEATPVTVPARDGDGEVTVDVGDRLDALAGATESDAITRHVRDLAWVANRDLPMIPVVESLDQQWLTDDEWAIPDDLESDPDATVRWAPTWLCRLGKLRYTGD